MSDLTRVLEAFSEAFGCGAVLWTRASAEAPLEVAATSGGDVTPPAVDFLTHDEVIRSRETALGRQLVARIPGRTRAWLGVGPVADDDAEPTRWMKVLVPALSQMLQSQGESSRAAAQYNA